MIIACHQPVFLPWSGFFYKSLNVDRLVLLDEVQYGRGFTWMNRNRLKYDQGELWLSVPVRKKGKGLQKICEVEISYDRDWPRKHLESLRQHYGHAPYYDEHRHVFEELYRQRLEKLVDFNYVILAYLLRAVGISEERIILQSGLQVHGRASELLIRICQKTGASHYYAPSMSRKYIDADLFNKHGIEIVYYSFTPPIYPQLYGQFIDNLSFLDLLLNCGPKSGEIILRYNQ